MEVKIFVMTHKHFVPPQNEIYVPLHVGRAESSDLGYLGDDSGENISAVNHRWGELTGLFWIWKNYDGPEKYIGINHYRRYFLNPQREFMTEEDIVGIFDTYDMIASERVASEKNFYDTYDETHNIHDLMEVGESLKRLYPEYAGDFEWALKEHALYSANLMVTDRQQYDAYCKWMFDILFDASERVDVKGYDLYHARVMGFLSEGLLTVWAKHHGLKVYEAPIGYTDEKAETRELRMAVGQLLSIGQFSEAEQMFNEVMTLRPDISLPMSDIKQEIPVIQQILYIGNQELARGIDGMFAQTRELSELMRLYDAYYYALQVIGGKDDFAGTGAEAERRFLSPEDARQYLYDHGFSDVALTVMVHYDLFGRYGCEPLNEEIISQRME